MKVVTLLLEKKCNIHLVTDGNSNAFKMACYMGSFEVAKLLMDAGCDLNLAENVNNTAPIHFAAMSGNVGLVKLLLHKCEKHCKDNDGYTALDLASRAGKSGQTLVIQKSETILRVG